MQTMQEQPGRCLGCFVVVATPASASLVLPPPFVGASTSCCCCIGSRLVKALRLLKST